MSIPEGFYAGAQERTRLWVRDFLLRRFENGAMAVHFGVLDDDAAMRRAGMGAVHMAVRFIDAHGPDTRLILEPLLDDPDPGVRAYAAGYLMKHMPDRALAALERLNEQRTGPGKRLAARFLRRYKTGAPPL